MKSPCAHTLLVTGTIWMGLASGCTAARAPAPKPVQTHALDPFLPLLAQAAVADCRLGDSTMICCIKKHPYDPLGACGAAASDVDAAVKAGARVEQALRRTTDEDAGDDEDADDPDEGWREHCRDTYVHCKSQMNPRWTGDCYACFRMCEGQRQWPFHLCKPKT